MEAVFRVFERNETIFALFIGAIAGLLIGYYVILFSEWLVSFTERMYRKYKWWRLPEEEKERRRKLTALYLPDVFPLNSLIKSLKKESKEKGIEWKEQTPEYKDF